MRSRPVVLTALVATLLLAVLPATASAAHFFDAFAGTEETEGDAHAYGVLSFIKGGRGVKLEGTIDDVCDADGYRARLKIEVQGQDRTGFAWRFYEDAGGCEGNGVKFKTTIGPQANIAYFVELRVYEQDFNSTYQPVGDSRTIRIRR